jgi:spectinomycin phosphotransferase
VEFGLSSENLGMIEKPNISDEKIIVCLNESYSIQVNHIEFLSIGNDPTAFAYRVEAKNGDPYFLKIKRELTNPAGLFVPRFLKDKGIEQVIAPLPTNSQKLWAEVDEFTLILYPFITGSEAMEIGMTDSQWIEFGSALKRIHTTVPIENIVQYVRHESFIPKWSDTVKAIHQRVNTQEYQDPYQKQLALLWKEKSETIQTVIERTEWTGKRLQQLNLAFFLCHADIHTANILIAPEQQMFIVDWDGALFAPKERDLMFVAGLKEESLFFKGYGDEQVYLPALAYYRYEWCMQEFSDYGEMVFSTTDVGENTKRNAVEKFIELFEPGDVVDVALNTPIEI